MKQLAAILLVAISHLAGAQDPNMALVRGGTFVPLYQSSDNDSTAIKDFYMDVTPVTHEQFAWFVKKYPRWQRGNVAPLFADNNYLVSWHDDTTPTEKQLKSPVNNVSWFAAKAYCECQGKRLPTVNEWEYAAMADRDSRDAREDSLYNQRIISGYDQRDTYLKTAGNTPANYWGVKDLHGLVWEWTLDFNATILTGESRKQNNDASLFCAGGAINASSLRNYGAFLRYALRSSLKANYTLKNLGFRCVKDVNDKSL